MTNDQRPALSVRPSLFSFVVVYHAHEVSRAGVPDLCHPWFMINTTYGLTRVGVQYRLMKNAADFSHCRAGKRMSVISFQWTFPKGDTC